MEIDATIRELRDDLMAARDPSKIDAMESYMKGHFDFLGVTTPNRRRAAKPLHQWARTADPDELVGFVGALWHEPEREFHYVGMDMLRAGARNLRPTDIEFVKGCIEATPWWDTVDGLAAWTVGPMVALHPELVDVMDAWIEHDNLWLARTAIIHQLGYKEATDSDRLFRYAVRRAGDTDFFIRKAIGWALRQYARVDPDDVRSFLDAHDGEFAGLTVREATKHLGP
ncbi:MAG: DNA alkylation repair protein [Acidimicrobiales bacterium]